MREPPPLRPGDRVAIVAPSSPFPRPAFFGGLEWLRERYALAVRPEILARSGYLAGDDDRRAAELGGYMQQPGIRAIVCARGGYGATRIARRLPWDAFAQHPKWIVGFSDVTALLLEAAARGVAAVHGANVTGLGPASGPARARVRASWLAALERPGSPRAWPGLQVVRTGRASGPAFGGNLSLVATMAAAGTLRVPDGAVVLLEDVTERPYRVDRMLTALLDGGHLARASAFVFGSFAQCTPGPDGVRVEEVLADRFGTLGVPVVTGAPFGHTDDNEAFVVGSTATLHGPTLTFTSS